MESTTVPEELLALREKIDSLDEEIVAILAMRFAVTSEVGKLKAKNQLNSVDPRREKEKLIKLRYLAQARSLNDDFIIKLFQMLFDEVVKNHRSYLK